MLAMFMLWLHAIVVVAAADGISAEVVSVTADGTLTSQGPTQKLSTDVVAPAIRQEARTVRRNHQSASVGSLDAEALVRKDDAVDTGGIADSVPQAARNADDATSSVAMPASLLVREAAPSSFVAAPAGTTKNLFIPAMHRCNDSLKQEFLKMYPGQASRTEKQNNLQTLLRSIHDVNAELGMPTILAHGTVLGFYRNCDVIPTDGDADTAVFGHWLQGKRSVENLAAAYAAHNITLQSGMCPNGPLYTGCELRAVHHNKAYCDLFVYAVDSACDEAPCSYFESLYSGGRVAPTFHKDASGKVRFEQADFLDRTFWIPTPTLDYLKLNYGNNWENPKGGVYKAVDFKHDTTSVPDIHGAQMPPPEYVKSLEQVGRMREQQLLTATPAQ